MLTSACMSHAKLALSTLGITSLVAAIVACGESSNSAFTGAGNPGSPSDSSDAGAAGKAATDVGPTATGVLLVHAAIMPNANVVGVEIGSFVRLDPLKAPGKIWVISESRVRSTPGNTTEVSCRDRLAKAYSTPNALVPNNDYHQAITTIDRPLGD